MSIVCIDSTRYRKQILLKCVCDTVLFMMSFCSSTFQPLNVCNTVCIHCIYMYDISVNNDLLHDTSNIVVDTTLKIVSEDDQEIPQSQTADHPMAPRGRAIQPSRDTRKTN